MQSGKEQYHKLCVLWVPNMLSDDLKTQRMGAALTFLQRYHDEEDDFVNKIVTGDETLVHCKNQETKEQFQQWMHSHSPNKPKKFKQTFSISNCLAIVF